MENTNQRAFLLLALSILLADNLRNTLEVTI